MSDGAYAGLRRAARAGSPDPEDTNNEPEATEDESTEAKGGKKKDKDMTDNTSAEALAQAKAEGAKATHDRYAAVMASEHYAGREKLAMKLLGNDKLTADEIVDTLSAADIAKPESADEGVASAAAETAARDEMKAALAETQNSEIDASGGGSDQKKQDASKIWDAAISANNPGIKLG